MLQSDYKSLKGMYPSAAEKLASNGPYKSVQDIYRIKDLTGTCYIGLSPHSAGFFFLFYSYLIQIIVLK